MHIHLYRGAFFATALQEICSWPPYAAFRPPKFRRYGGIDCCPRPEPNCPMAENEPLPDRPRPRWPLILGSLVGGFLMLAVGLGLGWYLFYRPIVNVAVQLPAPPAPPAPPGPDAAQVKALEDQIDKQKAANKQIEDQIAMLKDRLKADVCTIKDPLGKTTPPSTPAPAGALPERKT